MSLNLNNGNKLWYTCLNNSLISNAWPMALLHDKLFITGGTAIYCVKASTGNVLWTRKFDHYVLHPILADNKVFIVADMYVIAYK